MLLASDRRCWSEHSASMRRNNEADSLRSMIVWMEGQPPATKACSSCSGRARARPSWMRLISKSFGYLRISSVLMCFAQACRMRAIPPSWFLWNIVCKMQLPNLSFS